MTGDLFSCGPARSRLRALAAFFLLASLGLVVAEQGGGQVLSLTQENDFWTGTDRHYTHGVQLAYAMADDRMPRWARSLSDALVSAGLQTESEAVAFTLGQNIYTPANLSVPTSIPGDRPYAGWCYGGLALQREGRTSRGRTVWESWGLDLGVIGPAALGEGTQDFIHELSDSAKPRGWHNQLKNEPGVALKYQRTYRFGGGSASGWGADFLPHVGTSLGNISTDARLGVTLRFGCHLRGDYGPQTIDSLALPAATGVATESPFTACVFGGVEGRAIAYSAFFNGNLWENSHRISKEPLVASFKGGLVLGCRRCELAFTLVMRTREFKGQTSRDSFGSLALRLLF